MDRRRTKEARKSKQEQQQQQNPVIANEQNISVHTDDDVLEDNQNSSNRNYDYDDGESSQQQQIDKNPTAKKLQQMTLNIQKQKGGGVAPVQGRKSKIQTYQTIEEVRVFNGQKSSVDVLGGLVIKEEDRATQEQTGSTADGLKTMRKRMEEFQEEKQRFKPIKSCKNDNKKFYVEMIGLQGVNLTDKIMVKIELVDINNLILHDDNGQECSKIKELEERIEQKKLIKFEHLQIFHLNENIINERQYFKPRLQITFYLKKSEEVIGFVDIPLVSKKNKLQKGLFVKKMYKFDSIHDKKAPTPFKLSFITYRDIPIKWDGLIDKQYMANFNKGLNLIVENISDYKDKRDLAIEFAFLNNGKVMKDHNQDSIIYSTLGFNKPDQKANIVNFQYEQRIYQNIEMIFDQNRNNLHKLYIIITVFSRGSALGNEREEYGWYIHPMFRLREFNSGQFSVNLFKPPVENKAKFNLKEYQKLPCKINFNFVGFDNEVDINNEVQDNQIIEEDQSQDLEQLLDQANSIHSQEILNSDNLQVDHHKKMISSKPRKSKQSNSQKAATPQQFDLTSNN